MPATSNREAELLKQSVLQSSLTPAGSLTVPRSWGVYQLAAGPSQSKRFRYGNHPVRQSELEHEFGRVACVALFTSRPLASELAHLYNANR